MCLFDPANKVPFASKYCDRHLSNRFICCLYFGESTFNFAWARITSRFIFPDGSVKHLDRAIQTSSTDSCSMGRKVRRSTSTRQSFCQRLATRRPSHVTGCLLCIDANNQRRAISRVVVLLPSAKSSDLCSGGCSVAGLKGWRRGGVILRTPVGAQFLTFPPRLNY